MSSDLKFLHAFNLIPGIGPVSLRNLKSFFGSYEEAWKSSETTLQEAGLDARTLQAVLWKRPSLNPDRELEKVVRANIWLVTEDEGNYPEPLKEIPNPPVVLYARGQFTGSKQNIAVVGTRRPTAYGMEATERLTQELVETGLTIVSGLATGIDTKAHEVALENRGHTIAVLGSGVDPNSIFPPENRGLAKRIAETGGAVISEYAPGAPALKEHFPQRNRIIAGLSLGVLVVEAREKSGALITARLALEYNREVFAVPGSIFTPTSRGPNKLIQDGAKLVSTASDILTELGIEYTKETETDRDEFLQEQERVLLGMLDEPLGVDFIKEKTGLETAVIVASLSMLELKGRVRNLGGNTYQKTN